MKKIIPSWLMIFLVAALSFMSLLIYSSRQVNSADVSTEVFMGDASAFKDLELSVRLYAGQNALYEVSIPCIDVQEASGNYKNYEWKENLFFTESNSYVYIQSFGIYYRLSQETLPLSFTFYNNKTWIEEGKNQDLNNFTNMEFPYITTDDPEYYLEKEEVSSQDNILNSSDKLVAFEQFCMCVELNGKEYFTINNTKFSGPYKGKSGIFEVLKPKNNNATTYDSYVKLLYEIPISSESSRKVLQLVSWEQENTLGVIYIENERDLMLDVYSLDDDKVIASGKLTTMDTPYEKIVAKDEAFKLYTNSHYLSVLYKDEVQVFDYYDYGDGEPIAVESYESCKELLPELADYTYPLEVFYDEESIYFVDSYLVDKNNKLSNIGLCLIKQNNGEITDFMKYELNVPFYSIDRKNDLFTYPGILNCQILLNKKGAIHVRD